MYVLSSSLPRCVCRSGQDRLQGQGISTGDRPRKLYRPPNSRDMRTHIYTRQPDERKHMGITQSWLSTALSLSTLLYINILFYFGWTNCLFCFILVCFYGQYFHIYAIFSFLLIFSKILVFVSNKNIYIYFNQSQVGKV